MVDELLKNERTVNEGNADEQVLDTVLTVPNLISLVRLCMAPVFLVLLFQNQNIAAAILFAVAAATDFVDGQVARRTHQVSRLGQLLDPVVDRVLMITAVIGLLVVGRLPLWIVLVVLIRDLFLLLGGAYLLQRYRVRVAVIYPGKFATTFLFVGLAGLLINMPLVPGLGWCDFAWLPGFNAAACSWGIWFIYLGLIVGVFTTTYYIVKGVSGALAVRREERR